MLQHRRSHTGRTGLLALVLITPLVSLAPGGAASASANPLMVSSSSHRGGAVPLDGQAVRGLQYIYADLGPARRAAFYLDAATQPIRTDYHSPYDLGATGPDGSAVAVDTSAFGAGAHTMTLQVRRADGSFIKFRSSFTVSTPSDSSTFGPGRGRPFIGAAAWNLPIPGAPILDQNSSKWAAYLSSGGAAQSVLLRETGVPVFDAYASTPRYNVSCTMDWGPCPLEDAPVPIPANARPSTSSDGAMVIVDWSTGKSYEFWQVERSGGVWRTSWGSVNSVRGDGYDASAASPTGAGVSRLAGVVRTYEIEQGNIDHALVFASSISAPGVFRYPAAKTDGSNMHKVAVPLPEGARIQLDPTIDVDALPGITRGEVLVAKALQKYGAYNIDNGGYASMGFNFETPVDEPDPYAAAGLAWDYAGMPHIPWTKLRVLRTWNGQ